MLKFANQTCASFKTKFRLNIERALAPAGCDDAGGGVAGLASPGRSRDGCGDGGQTAQPQAGLRGADGVMWLESFALQSAKVMIFGGEVKHSELPRSELEKRIPQSQAQWAHGNQSSLSCSIYFFSFHLN